MSDIYGIGAAIEACVQVYSLTSRGTGRTTALLDMLSPGDRVVFTSMTHANHTIRLLRDRFKKDVGIEIIISDPKHIGMLFEKCRGTPTNGRTFFDHTWIEQYFLNCIVCGQEDLRRIAADLSSSRANAKAETMTRKAIHEMNKMNSWR